MDRQEKTDVAMLKTSREGHDTDMIKEMGKQMKEILAGSGCDHAKKAAMEALGLIFKIEHSIK